MSDAWKCSIYGMHVCSVTSHAWLFATPWTLAHQASLSMGFPRQEYWNGLPFPPPGDLPNPEIEIYVTIVITLQRVIPNPVPQLCALLPSIQCCLCQCLAQLPQFWFQVLPSARWSSFHFPTCLYLSAKHWPLPNWIDTKTFLKVWKSDGIFLNKNFYRALILTNCINLYEIFFKIIMFHKNTYKIRYRICA